MPVNRRVFLDIKSRTATGRLIIELFDKENPKTAENFRALCTGEKGTSSNGTRLWYKGCPIHRIVPDFLIQGGDITNGDGTGGEAIYEGDVIEEENPRWLDIDRAGLLVNANQGADINTSQFFISCCPLPDLENYIVFGQVVDGLDLIDKLEQVEVDDNDCPVQSDRVTIVNCGQLEFKKRKKASEPVLENMISTRKPDDYEKERQPISDIKPASENEKIRVNGRSTRKERVRGKRPSTPELIKRDYNGDRSPGGGDYYRPNHGKRKSRYEIEEDNRQSGSRRDQHDDDDRKREPEIQFKGRGRMTYREKSREYGRLS